MACWPGLASLQALFYVFDIMVTAASSSQGIADSPQNGALQHKIIDNL
jgi:hypothetical protein